MGKMIVESRIREWLKAQGLRLGGTAVDEIENKLMGILKEGVRRAKADGAKTLAAKYV